MALRLRRRTGPDAGAHFEQTCGSLLVRRNGLDAFGSLEIPHLDPEDVDISITKAQSADVTTNLNGAAAQPSPEQAIGKQQALNRRHALLHRPAIKEEKE